MVVNSLSMYAILQRSDKGVADLPALSEVFVRSLIVLHEVDAPNTDVKHTIRLNGLMGTHLGVNFCCHHSRRVPASKTAWIIAAALRVSNLSLLASALAGTISRDPPRHI